MSKKFKEKTLVVAHVSTESADHYLVDYVFQPGEQFNEDRLKEAAGSNPDELEYHYVEDWVEYTIKDLAKLMKEPKESNLYR